MDTCRKMYVVLHIPSGAMPKNFLVAQFEWCSRQESSSCKLEEDTAAGMAGTCAGQPQRQSFLAPCVLEPTAAEGLSMLGSQKVLKYP